MKRFLAAPLILFLLASPLAAATKITGETEVKSGLVKLKAETDVEGAAFSWTVFQVGGGELFGERQLYEDVAQNTIVFTGPAGTYSVKCLAISFDGKRTKIETARATVTIGDAPVPPGPGPTPPGPTPPTPDPPSPAPIPAAGFRVLMILETADASKLPAAQQSVLFSKSVRDYLNSKCVVGVDGKTKEWRIWDFDSATDAESKIWQDAMKRKPTDKSKLPWVIISNPAKGGGYEGPLPANVDEMMKLLRKYGGD